MEKIYLFTAVLVYIQIHIQLWEWYKDSNMRHKLKMLARGMGWLTSWSVFICLICCDLFITIAAAKEIAKLGNIPFLRVISVKNWEIMYKISSWMANISMIWTALSYLRIAVMFGRERGDRKSRRNTYKLIIQISIFIGFFILLGYWDLGGSPKYLLDGIAWYIYKLLLFLGVVDH